MKIFRVVSESGEDVLGGPVQRDNSLLLLLTPMQGQKSLDELDVDAFSFMFDMTGRERYKVFRVS